MVVSTEHWAPTKVGCRGSVRGCLDFELVGLAIIFFWRERENNFIILWR